MNDNFLVVLMLSILLILLVFFSYKIFAFSKDISINSSEQRNGLDKIDYLEDFAYLLNKQPLTIEDFQKEELFLLRYLNKNNSLKHLSDCYERIEMYIDFKLDNIVKLEEEKLLCFCKEKYSEIQQNVKKEFEKRQSELLAHNIGKYFLLHTEENMEIEARDMTSKCLVVQLLKLKSKNYRRELRR
ncbi:hypothetical protein [Entomomonas asaccharolytica]|uniref:Uncharacterized protein n=1 Tax=Entomomonas asaccharolytica TaxID=2785331 RepID=A0A974NEH4_9GAMM|nr:hypothetical protein [Entomomonas asaccharolytica]QQP85198.1 hypothetical protein JHT90_12530 [Entomomonas asaccharolytica]